MLTSLQLLIIFPGVTGQLNAGVVPVASGIIPATQATQSYVEAGS